jgi:predicted secreted protein
MTTTSVGRKITLTWGGATIGGVREKGVALGGAPIDITDVGDAGWQELITTDLAQYDVKLTIAGVTKDNKIKTDWFAGTYSRQIVVTYIDGSTLTFTGVIAAYADAAPYNGAATFTAEFMSTGTPSWSAAS